MFNQFISFVEGFQQVVKFAFFGFTYFFLFLFLEFKIIAPEKNLWSFIQLSFVAAIFAILFCFYIFPKVKKEKKQKFKAILKTDHVMLDTETRKSEVIEAGEYNLEKVENPHDCESTWLLFEGTSIGQSLNLWRQWKKNEINWNDKEIIFTE